jgi:hypothetical protein
LRFTESGQELWRRIQDVLGRAWKWVKTVFQGIKDAVAAGDMKRAAEIAWTAVLAVIANAVDWIIGVADGLRGSFGATFGAMLDLIRTGDWQGAAELAMSALAAAWHTGIAHLMESWGGYIRAVVETFAGAMAQIARFTSLACLNFALFFLRLKNFFLRIMLRRRWEFLRRVGR